MFCVFLGAVLVTDAIAAMGLCEGEHNFGHITVNVTSKQRVSCKDTNTSVGTLKDAEAQAGTTDDVLVVTVKGTDTLAGRYALWFVYLFMGWSLLH